MRKITNEKKDETRVRILAGQFAMNLNLGSEILILGRDIRSRSWLNIGDSYNSNAQYTPEISKSHFFKHSWNWFFSYFVFFGLTNFRPPN